MNPDAGDDAEDWFAKFEREAREAAQKREQTEAAPPPSAAPMPPAPQLTNPFDAPTVPPAAAPPPTPAWDPQATQAMARFEPEPTQAMPAQPTHPTEATQALVPAPLQPPHGEPGSALDALFGDDRFREYDSTLGPDPSNAPFANRARSKELVHVPGQGTPPPPRAGFGRTQKILAGVGGGLLAVIALIALFLLGTRLPDLVGPAPAVATPTPTPTPTITALPIGPVAPGFYEWDELLGGECLDPYDTTTGAWGEEFTVVDCAAPHAAQMVYRAWFPPAVVDPENPQVGKPDDPFPGVEALQAQITLLCSAAGVVDLAAAGAYADVQVQGSYPVTEEQWDADPSYFCFVNRSSGEPLTGSVAIPRQPAEPVQPAPEG